MELIKTIKIEGLRSIQIQDLLEIGSLNVFVGRNSSGKSNALRALNLFFNGTIEPGKTIDFVRDHYEQIPRKKKKKTNSYFLQRQNSVGLTDRGVIDDDVGHDFWQRQ